MQQPISSARSTVTVGMITLAVLIPIATKILNQYGSNTPWTWVALFCVAVGFVTSRSAPFLRGVLLAAACGAVVANVNVLLNVTLAGTRSAVWPLAVVLGMALVGAVFGSVGAGVATASRRMQST